MHFVWELQHVSTSIRWHLTSFKAAPWESQYLWGCPDSVAISWVLVPRTLQTKRSGSIELHWSREQDMHPQECWQSSISYTTLNHRDQFTLQMVQSFKYQMLHVNMIFLLIFPLTSTLRATFPSCLFPACCLLNEVAGQITSRIDTIFHPVYMQSVTKTEGTFCFEIAKIQQDSFFFFFNILE